jgi:Leucine Rich repeat
MVWDGTDGGLDHFSLGDAAALSLVATLQTAKLPFLSLRDNRLTDVSLVPLLRGVRTAGSTSSSSSGTSSSATVNGAAQHSNSITSSSVNSSSGLLPAPVLLSLNNSSIISSSSSSSRGRDTPVLLLRLDLSYNTLGAAAIAALQDFLEHAPPLQQLQLRKTQLLDSTAAQLCEALACAPSLHTVDLSENTIGNACAAALSRALEAFGCALADVDLSW